MELNHQTRLCKPSLFFLGSAPCLNTGSSRSSSRAVRLTSKKSCDSPDATSSSPSPGDLEDDDGGESRLVSEHTCQIVICI
jgi:hypothetical protein